MSKIKLNDAIIPVSPFIWYREEEFMCPIDYSGILTIEKVKSLYNYDIETNIPIIVQRHVKNRANLYICLHSLLFYELHKGTNGSDTLFVIPEKYIVNMPMEVKIVMLNGSLINEIVGGLKMDQYISGTVFIHGQAFSPPNCLHFRVGKEEDIEKTEFLCFIRCESLKIEMCCLFVLFNDLNGLNIDKKVEDYVANL
ncbi:MAG: hypothetical protein Barrevirus10_4 [Barrevirus sp.]|uniref:Uncharacterized protein n=1 Tax=Barrevirus sp. TaxID=2487763 RepID=A0A3G4ZQ76_9VIRU|nr:MAG: hypothetical protein Barrevirus10_4 [Barrevirus sp.]